MLMHHHLILVWCTRTPIACTPSCPNRFPQLSTRSTTKVASLQHRYSYRILSLRSRAVFNTCYHVLNYSFIHYYYYLLSLLLLFTIDSPYPIVASALRRPSSVFHTRWRAFHAVIWLPSSIGSHFPRAKAWSASSLSPTVSSISQVLQLNFWKVVCVNQPPNCFWVHSKRQMQFVFIACVFKLRT